MRFAKVAVMAFLIGSAAVFTACETSDDNAYAKAQACLDKAGSSADGTNCIRMVNGLSGEKASLIRCSATYLRRGFTNSKFVTAFDKLKSGANPAVELMSVMAFTGTATETGNAATSDSSYLVSECGSSKSPGMIYMAMATNTATIAANLTGTDACGTDTTAAGFATCVKSNLATIATPSAAPATQAQIGAAAISAQTSYCSSPTADPKLCSQISQAVSQGGGDAAATGAALANLLK